MPETLKELLDRRAREVLDQYNANPEPGLPVARFAYASFNRPVSYLWFRAMVPFALVHDKEKQNNKVHPHTWVLSERPLHRYTVSDYELIQYAEGYEPGHQEEAPTAEVAPASKKGRSKK